MLTSSAKSKGRRLQQAVREKLLAQPYAMDTANERALQPGDVRVAIMGESGLDIKLSPWAEEVVPLDIECKNVEIASPWAWMKQAKANTREGRMPAVCFTRNRENDIYVMMRLDDVLKLLR
jgi:hypothetical protein